MLLDMAAQNYIAHLRKRHGRRHRSPEAVRAMRALEATAASAAQKARDLANYTGERLLSEDHDPIKPVPAKSREVWEQQRTGYTREQFEADHDRRDNET